MSIGTPSKLPVVALPASSVEVGGATVAIRSLSRKEAMHVGSAFKEDLDGAEVFILAKGCDIPEAEAAAWRDATSVEEAGKVIDAIVYLSGLATAPVDGVKDGPDPQV